MNHKLLIDIEKESTAIPTLTEAINHENRTDSPESHWLKEVVLKEIVSRHRTTVQELAKLVLVLHQYNPDMDVFEIKKKLSQQANFMVQACLDDCLPSIEHHLRLLLERDLQKQIDALLS